MTDDTDTHVDIEDNLEAFESEFYNPTVKEEPVEEKQEETEEEVDENESDQLAPDEDEDADEDSEDEESDEDEDEEEDEEPEEVPQPKRNRKSAKERIEELVAKNREAERREAELLRRLEAVEARNKEVEKPEDVREILPADAPSPDAVGEDGEPLYALGEFDPQFIRDLTKFTIEQETKAAREQEARRIEAENMEKARKEIADAWIDKVAEAEKEIPDLRDNMKELTKTFDDLDPAYGEYLASTIMISEAGPQIMNYLSQNIGEAQKIVASGPAAATLALGRLEARLLKSSTEPDEKRNQKRVSKASEPPEERARGRSGQFAVAPDTDNLEAFEREFFK